MKKKNINFLLLFYIQIYTLIILLPSSLYIVYGCHTYHTLGSILPLHALNYQIHYIN